MTMIDWLRNDKVNRCLLVESSYLHEGVEHSVYFSDTGYVSEKTDTPGFMPYDDIIVNAPSFTKRLRGSIWTFEY